MLRIDRAALLAAAVLAACSSQTSLIGGQCAPGYEPCGHACCLSPVRATSGDASTQGDASADLDGALAGDGAQTMGDGGATTSGDADVEGGGMCPPPQILCGNVCLDPTNDPNNCGACGKVCPSNSCVNGKCAGSAPGSLIAIGHDYEAAPQPASAQTRVVVNAMLVPLSSPVRVMSFEEYSSATAVSNVKTLVQSAAMKLGRSLVFTTVVSDAQVAAQLDITSYDVLFVPDQKSAAQGALGSIGSAWSKALGTFVQAGGVVIVLDGATGTGEMPDLLTQSGLLQVSSHALLKSPSLTVVQPNDAVGVGVVSPYFPTNHTASFSTESNGGDVTYVIKHASDPCVVHKVFP